MSLDHGDDPGWFSGWNPFWLLVPFLAVRRAQAGGANGLALLRVVFSVFATALVLIGVLVPLLASDSSPESSELSAGVVALGVAGYGVVSLLLPGRLERPLDCTSDGALALSYRTRFFLRIAFADAAALVGFVGFFLAGEAWMYPLGAAFAAVGFVRLAPSRRNLERDQETLTGEGCGRSLTLVLAVAEAGPTAS